MIIVSDVYRIVYSNNAYGKKEITINIENDTKDDYFYSGHWAEYNTRDCYNRLTGPNLRGRISISCNLDSYFKLKELFK